MISLTNICKDYGELRAVRDVSIEIDRGEIIGLVGPNGAGKTTLMKMITGFLLPTSGTILVDGLDVATRQTAAQKRIGYLPEHNPLYPEMPVQDYLVFIGEMRGLSGERLIERLRFASDACGLRDVLIRPIRQLSKGFRQRVGIAAAIIHDPDILILDEPTSGLDPNQIIEIRSLIHELGKDKTVILSTHILSEVEETCTRAIMIVGGQKGADGSVSELVGGRDMRIVLANDCPPDTAESIQKELSSQDMIESIEALPEGRGFRVAPKDGASIGSPLFELASRQSWPVAEIAIERRSLEDVFREVTATASEGGQA